jgi:hypothetical protein
MTFEDPSVYYGSRRGRWFTFDNVTTNTVELTPGDTRSILGYVNTNLVLHNDFIPIVSDTVGGEPPDYLGPFVVAGNSRCNLFGHPYMGTIFRYVSGMQATRLIPEWRAHIPDEDGIFIIAVFSKNDVFYLLFENGNAYTSTDDGENWSRFGNNHDMRLYGLLSTLAITALPACFTHQVLTYL